MAGTMGGIEEFLKFTIEVGGEFPEGWLPTLKVALKVTPQNQIVFYEKPEGAKTPSNSEQPWRRMLETRFSYRRW